MVEVGQGKVGGGRGFAAVVALVLGASTSACHNENDAREMSGDGGQGSGKSDDGRASLTIEQYARDCEDAIGPIPSMHCPDGGLIPIQRTNADGSVTEITYDYLMSPDGQAEDPVTCDSPVQVLNAHEDRYNGCLPNSRLISVEGENARGETYQWVSICRHFSPRPPDEHVYDEIGTIGYNKDTGASCFIAGALTDFEQDGQQYSNVAQGKRRPRVGDPDFGKHYALPAPSFGCTRCHNNDPWLFNPYVDEIVDPSTGQLRRWADRNPRGAPFEVVDGEALRDLVGTAPPRDATSYTLDPAEAPRCTGCHDIGNRYHCSRFVPAAFEDDDGLEHPWTIEWRSHLSDGVLASPSGGAWHLDSLPDLRNLADAGERRARFESRYGDSYRRVLECCDQEATDECNWRTIVGPGSGGGQAPPPVRHGDVEFSWYRSPSGASTFDPGRGKVAIFIHGWHQTGRAESLYLDFTFGTLIGEGQLIDHATALEDQGYNVAILSWFDASHTDNVAEAEQNIFDADFAADLQLAYREGLQSVRRAAESRGESLEIRLIGHSLGCAVASQVVAGVTGLLGEDASLIPAGEVLWPSRVACIDPYFSKPISCENPGERGCVKEAWNQPALFDSAALTFERFSIYHAANFGRDPRYALEVYATKDQLFELIGNKNRQLLEIAVLEELEVEAGGVQANSYNPLDWIWDWGNRRHTYPLYWYFSTWVSGHDPSVEGNETGISAATSPDVLRFAIQGRYFFTQTDGGGDLDPTNDSFERRSQP